MASLLDKITGAAGAKQAGAIQAQGVAEARGALNDYTTRAAGEYGKALGYLDTGNTSAVNQLSPYADWGREGLNKLAYYTSSPARTAEMVMSDPSYQFRFDQGVTALDRSGAARGMSLSGAAARALTGYGQNFASQEYGNAYDRLMGRVNTGYQADNTIGNWNYNTGTNKAGVSTGLGGVYANTGNALADLITGGANAQAASKIAQGNALTNLIGTGLQAAGAYYGAKG